MEDLEDMGKNMDYRLKRVIGEGAFSRVYLTEDRNGQQYACKVSTEVRLLRREAEILGSLHHPLFPVYVGYEETGGEGRLFMEYIPGRNLRKVMCVRKFSAMQTMRIAGELADGLLYLHERQPVILYRDLKPENIMLCENGHIRLIDLGCACRQDAQGGAKTGTPGFAPQEQLVSGKTAGVYSDVYALGKTVQSMLAEKGRRCDREGGCAVRDDFRQRPQDMVEVLCILTGQKKVEKDVICEKNIWESHYKNPCSLPLI